MAHQAQKRHSSKFPIFVRGRDRPIGYVAGGVFRKTVRASVHFLSRPKAVAFDKSTIEDAEKAGAVSVEVTDSETGNTYRAAITDVWRFGFPVLRGYGSQIALPLTRWSVNGRPVAAVFESNQTVKAAQPSLWEGVER